MKIKVNGVETHLDVTKKGISLSGTLDLLGYKPNTVVVELNRTIVNSESLANQSIQEGDNIEIVSIVGGG